MQTIMSIATILGAASKLMVQYVINIVIRVKINNDIGMVM